MATLKALKAFRDAWSGKQRVKHELFTIDDIEEAARLVDEGYAIIPGDKEPEGTPAPEGE